MSDIQEAKCFEFTVQIPPPQELLGGGKFFFRLSLDLLLYTLLVLFPLTEK